MTTVVSKTPAWNDCLSDAGLTIGGCQNTTTATEHWLGPVDDAVIVIAHSYDAPISRKSGQNPKTKIKNHEGTVKRKFQKGKNIELSLKTR